MCAILEESINQYFNSFKDRNKASLKSFTLAYLIFLLKNKIVLDFACGTGELAESLVLKNAKKVIGIEKKIKISLSFAKIGFKIFHMIN